MSKQLKGRPLTKEQIKKLKSDKMNKAVAGVIINKNDTSTGQKRERII